MAALFAYEENFDSYKDGTTAKSFADSGITFETAGVWEVFSTPFSRFDTPVFLEPGKAPENTPLTLRFDTPQCQVAFAFATDGKDTLNLVGYYHGVEVYRHLFSGENGGDLYYGDLNIEQPLDSLTLSTVNGKKLLIDSIKTQACTLDAYTLSDHLAAHFSFDSNTTDFTTQTGILDDAIALETLKAPLRLDVSTETIKSIAFWFFLPENSSTVTLLHTVDPSETDRCSIKILGDGRPSLDLSEAYFSPYVNPTIISGGAWHHVVITRGDSLLSITIDGNVIGSYTTAATLYQKGDTLILEPGSGILMDDLRLYSTPLSLAETVELYHTREDFTTLADERFNAGKQFCIDNPEACGLRLGTTDADLSLEHDIEALRNQQLTFSWYLFSAPDGSTYLASGDFSNPHIWQLVPDTREWKPVHNAAAFDGYAGRGSIFDSVVISPDASSILFGEAADINVSE